MSQETNLKLKILEVVNLKERVKEMFESFDKLPNYLIESLLILIRNFHITNEQFKEMNKINFNYV